MAYPRRQGSAGALLTTPAIEAACEVLDREDPANSELLDLFTRLLYAKAPPEFFEDRAAAMLAAIARSDFDYLNAASPSAVNVDITNPVRERDGWTAPVTVIRTLVSERPFVVDTIREYLHAQDLAIERFLHPVMHLERTAAGGVAELAAAAGGPPLESFVHCEIARVEDPQRRQELRDAIAEHLEDVVRATEDFEAMVRAINDTIDYLAERARVLPERASEIEEIQAFLRWLRDGGFVILGYRGYDIEDTRKGRAIRVEPGSGLGLLRDDDHSTFAKPVLLDTLKSGLRERVAGGPLLITSKTNALSTVHRRVRMDYVGVKKLDDDGRVVGERRFIGLFTSQAYSEDAEKIPLLREKLRTILDEAGVIRGSHDYKEIITIFNSMPKEELFITSAEQIGEEIQMVLALYHTHEVRVMVRPDPLERGLSVMVVMPKEKFSGEVRKSIEEEFATKLGGEVLNYHLALGGGDQARLHFYFAAAAERIAETEPAELERIVRRLTRSWTDWVRERLQDALPGDEARRLARAYGEAFSPEYRAATEPAEAAQDILELEAMAYEGRSVAIGLGNRDEAEVLAVGEPATILKVYLRGERLILSDFMPILDNAGLRVLAMSPFEVQEREGGSAAIYVFSVQDPDSRPIDLVERGGHLADTILAVRAGEAASDPLNALVLVAGLAWREVDLLRAYSEYAFQLEVVPSRISLVNALRAYPGAARLLLTLFTTKFDPSLELALDERVSAAAELEREFVRSLEQVSTLAEDRALRRLLEILQATVRTNYYQHGGARPRSRSGGVPYVSLKFACEAFRGSSRSRLKYEVWVHSARMAGVHLRGAPVARGGIRYSDRPDDFRTEVVGLVKTQMVKNAVIVPAGSKGGFITRVRHDDREAMADEVNAQYQTLMRGLLDITDNLVDGEIVLPAGVVAHDGPDPYLVVAADKGTAHLSDVANAVAREYGFWLDDAFASGGSRGYDHKKVGITAKGAWECVRRHFRELGTDVQADPFTVVGIGDMSGDVFGNGMLLSRQIRLIAAFDHRHIFIDPDPDPETSYRERQRMFGLARGTWADYDRSVLSEGGMLVPRGVKEVQLTPEARAALGIAQEEALDGEALIRAILRAPADLLWNGGIGTYIKAASESHPDVGDSANDAVRIDAAELRVRVIGEGGNLGLTQKGRVQAALRGIRLNTDAIDNSAGVDMSDHEVNLKILLGGAVSAGRLDMEGRNALLETLTGPVEELVLKDNRSQSLAISLEQMRAEERVEDFHDLMLRLERDGLLDRGSEHLPSLEVLVERRARDRTLTRPELCVLLAYAKLALKGQLLVSPLPDDPASHTYLVEYLPVRAVETAGPDGLAAHRLRREIISSQLVNDLVDLMGATFVNRVVRDTGLSQVEVVRAWLIASTLCGARPLRESLAAIEHRLPAHLIYRWLRGLARVLERTTRWVLANVSVDVPSQDVIEQHAEGLGQLRDRFTEIVAGEEKALFEERVREMRALTEQFEAAERLITLRFLDQLLEILRVARESGRDAVRVGRAYYLTSEMLLVPWLRRAILAAAGEDRWEQRVAHALVEDVGRAHRAFTERVVAAGEDADVEVDRLLERVSEQRSRELYAYRELAGEIRQEERPSLAALSIVVRELQALATPL
ncbi:MAG: NAD-glutamate dehydrogenase [Longimicrobiales bacterium]